MRTIIRILAAVALTAAIQPPLAQASIVRALGPTSLFYEAKAFVKFDMAFDEVNRRYLVVWGVQCCADAQDALRTRGLFLNEAGQPIGSPFIISDGPVQAGWARVVYSAEEDRFLVSYTKMLSGTYFQRAARFVTSAAGVVGPEILLDSGVGANNPGLAYSAASRKWLVTWWKWTSPFPTSYVGVIDAVTGAYNGPVLVSNTADGQSDPNIACDPSSRRCLVAGYAWGMPFGEVNSTWGRFVDDSSGAPVGDPFYVDVHRVEGESTIVFNATSRQFVVGFSRDMNSVWASTVAPTGQIAGPYLVRGPDGSPCSDGAGYGRPALAPNAGTGTVLVGMIDRCNVVAAQEIDGQAVAIAGAFDRLAGAAQAVTVAADAAARRYLLGHNEGFYYGRSTLYTADGVASPPPPAPTSNPAMSIDVPVKGAIVNQPFFFSGWAIDRASMSGGPGVDAVHVWAWPIDGNAPRWVGTASYGWSRPDVGAYFGGQFTNSGYAINVDGLPGGGYHVAAYLHSVMTGTFTMTLDVPVIVAEPLMSVDTPSPNAVVPASGFLVGGWSIDRGAPVGTGVDTLHLWAYPESGAPPIFAGVATPGVPRPDVSAVFGARYLNAGFNAVVNNLPAGTYYLVAYSHSTLTGTFNALRVVRITVQ